MDFAQQNAALRVHRRWNKWLQQCITHLRRYPDYTLDCTDRIVQIEREWLFFYDDLNETPLNTISCSDIGFVLWCLMRACTHMHFRRTVSRESIFHLLERVRLSHIRHAHAASESYAIATERDSTGAKFAPIPTTVISASERTQLSTQCMHMQTNHTAQNALLDELTTWFAQHMLSDELFTNEDERVPILHPLLAKLSLIRDEREQDEAMAQYACSSSLLFQRQSAHLRTQQTAFICGRLWHAWQFERYLLQDACIVNAPDLRDSQERLLTLINEWRSIDVSEKFVVAMRATVLESMLPIGARRVRYRLQSTRLAYGDPMAMLGAEVGNPAAAQLGEAANVKLNLSTTDWRHEWFVLCMFAHAYDQRMRCDTPFMSEFWIAESQLFDQRHVLLQCTHEHHRPRRPRIVQVRRALYVQTLDDVSRKQTWHACHNTAHAVVTWLSLIKTHYDSALSTGQSMKYWTDYMQV